MGVRAEARNIRGPCQGTNGEVAVLGQPQGVEVVSKGFHLTDKAEQEGPGSGKSRDRRWPTLGSWNVCSVRMRPSLCTGVNSSQVGLDRGSALSQSYSKCVHQSSSGSLMELVGNASSWATPQTYR